MPPLRSQVPGYRILEIMTLLLDDVDLLMNFLLINQFSKALCKYLNKGHIIASANYLKLVTRWRCRILFYRFYIILQIRKMRRMKPTVSQFNLIHTRLSVFIINVFVHTVQFNMTFPFARSSGLTLLNNLPPSLRIAMKY